MAATDLPKPVDLVFIKKEPSAGADASKLPLVFGHGLFSNKSRWEEISVKLAELTGRTAYAVDLRDHGESPRTNEFNFKAMISDILHFLEKNSISKAIFCGHSLSGMLFSRLATLFGDRVESVIMVDINPCKKPQEPNLVSAIIPVLLVIIETIRSERIADLEQARKRADEVLSKAIEDENVRKHFLENLVVRGDKVDWIYNIDVISKNWSTLFGFEDLIPSFSLPALEIYGSESPFINKDHFPSILEKIPNCKFVEVAGADHIVPYTHPDKVVEAIAQFLAN